MTNPLNRRRMPTLPTAPPSVMLKSTEATSSCSHAQTRRSWRDLRLSANLGQFRDLELVARSERDGSKGTIARSNPDRRHEHARRAQTRTLSRFVASPSTFGRLGGSKRVSAEQVDGGRGVAAIESVDQVRVSNARLDAVSGLCSSPS